MLYVLSHNHYGVFSSHGSYKPGQSSYETFLMKSDSVYCMSKIELITRALNSPAVLFYLPIFGFMLIEYGFIITRSRLHSCHNQSCTSLGMLLLSGRH